MTKIMNSKKSKRKNTPNMIETEVLTKSRRRCPLCIYLKNDFSSKRSQIAHIDHDPSNYKFDNLVYLCLEHHSNYDSKTSQAKGYQANEIKKYRNLLYSNINDILLKPEQRIKLERITNDLFKNFKNIIESKSDSVIPTYTCERLILKYKDYLPSLGILTRGDYHFVILDRFHVGPSQLNDMGVQPVSKYKDDPTLLTRFLNALSEYWENEFGFHISDNK